MYRGVNPYKPIEQTPDKRFMSPIATVDLSINQSLYGSMKRC
jgi:hypothetical protein